MTKLDHYFCRSIDAKNVLAILKNSKKRDLATLTSCRLIIFLFSQTKWHCL